MNILLIPLSCTCGSPRLYRRILLLPWTDPRPTRGDASPALRPHDQLKILSCFLHSLFPLSLPLRRQPSEGGGTVMCREAKWITQARLPYFHSSRKSELPLGRDLLCGTTLPSLGKNFGLLKGPKFSLIRVYK
jgi:hypothetical protein